MSKKVINKTDSSIQNVKVTNIPHKHNVIVDNFPEEQRVTIANFPRKDKWDKLSIAITIISLFIAIISTYLYINELNKQPDLFLVLDASSDKMSKSSFIFKKNSEYSEKNILKVALFNRGNKKSESVKLILHLHERVKIKLSDNFFDETGTYALVDDLTREKQDSWKCIIGDKIRNLQFKKSQLFVNIGTSEFIGKFDMSIPKKNNEDLFVGVFILEGDFDRKSGTIFYSYINEKFIINYCDTPYEAVEVWDKYFYNGL